MTQEAEKALETLQAALDVLYINGEHPRLDDAHTDATAALRSLRTQLEQVTKERDEAQRWMRFIAETQHRLLEAFRVELSDEEWVAFAEALGIAP